MELSTHIDVKCNNKKNAKKFNSMIMETKIESVPLEIIDKYFEMPEHDVLELFERIFDDLKSLERIDRKGKMVNIYTILGSLNADEFLEDFFKFTSRLMEGSTATATTVDDDEGAVGIVKLKKNGVIVSPGVLHSVYYDPDAIPPKK